MSSFVTAWYLRLFDMLSTKHKVELISSLAERLNRSFADEDLAREEKRRLDALETMMISWKTLEVDGDFIVRTRTVDIKKYDL